MATVATIRTTAYNTIYNHLQTGTYAISTNNIHPRYNDTQLRQEGYPQVIILPPKIKTKKLTVNGDILLAEVNFLIQVRHNSAANLKTSMDEIYDKIKTGITVFTAANFYPIDDGEDDYDEDYGLNTSKVSHIGTLNFNYKYVGTPT